jgi:FkbM family methyltransferase
LDLPFVCHVGDESGEAPFYNHNLSIPELAIMSAWCEKIDRPVIFDIGANNGFVATQLAQRLRKNNPRIYAFEPVPSTYAQLKLSVESLRLSDLVFPICCGVSDSTGIATMSYNPRQSLFAQMRDGAPNPRVGNLSTLAATLTIDQIIDSLAIKPTLIKIDIEGYEPRALRGASKLLASDEPPAICFEWNPLTLSEVKSSSAELIQSLANFHFYYIDDFEGQRKPFAGEISDLDKIDWVCNVVAIPRSQRSEHRWAATRPDTEAKITSNWSWFF